MSVEGFLSEHNNYTGFWGLQIGTDFPEDHEAKYGIHVVMACIDIKEETVSKNSKPPRAALWLEKGNDEYQVCRLTQELRQQPLNLVFEKGLYVRFYVVGNASIYIYGYRIRKADGTEESFLDKSKEVLSASLSESKDDSICLGKYSHIIDTTTYTISDGNSSDDSESRSSPSSEADSEVGYTTESTPRSESLGSSTSCESPEVKKKMATKKKNGERKD